jgi:hypothetical protein
MFSTTFTYIGVDPTAGQKPMVFVALDDDLGLLALSQGDLDEILAFAAGQRQAFIAISSPRRPNQGLMDQEQIREQLLPAPRPGRWNNFRVAEYQLRQHGISIPQTHANPSDCPNWVQTGFQLYQRLEKFGYLPYPTPDSERQTLEVYPHACFTSWLDRLPFPKQSLEGRLQRQLLLYERRLRLPDPMRFFEEITRHRLLQGMLPGEILHTPAELDALAAAYTAWQAAHHPAEITLLGHPEEGQIVLPIAEMKARY